jgi:hypothetical protein
MNMGASAAPRFQLVSAQTEGGSVAVSVRWKCLLVAVVLAVRVVAFQPVRKVIRQQRVVWVSLRGRGQRVGEME